MTSGTQAKAKAKAKAKAVKNRAEIEVDVNPDQRGFNYKMGVQKVDGEWRTERTGSYDASVGNRMRG